MTFGEFKRHGLILMWETTKGIKLMDKIAKTFRPILKYWSYLGILVGYAGMIYLLYYLFGAFVQPSPQPVVSPVIPGLRIPGSQITVPLVEGILAILTLLIVHEGGHGVIARVHNIKVKSAGVGLLAILPFAFVKPDEKQLAKAPLIHRLSMYAAGPWANITTAALAAVAMIFLVTPALFGAFDLTGLEIVGTTEGYPAELAGLTEGDILIAIDSVSTSNYKEFSTTMASKVPGDTVAFQLEDRTIEITATQNPNNLELAHFGFSYQPELEPTKWYSGLLLSFSKFLNWFFILSLGIGLFNLLPIPILDGGKMLHDGLFGIVKNKKRASKIFMYLSFFSIALLIGAILLPFIA
ncbi:MAG: hypothetical protein CXT77_00865 [uncultured DHVE6 group euryarchaeote]|jgi:membrane-associated protease RseP (regulator of RpoE activity)|nr:MAG: hypothetical protein CXT77_00865 [uncultured DHVE6 group euryarchaeote]